MQSEVFVNTSLCLFKQAMFKLVDLDSGSKWLFWVTIEAKLTSSTILRPFSWKLSKRVYSEEIMLKSKWFYDGATYIF